MRTGSKVCAALALGLLAGSASAVPVAITGRVATNNLNAPPFNTARVGDLVTFIFDMDPVGGPAGIAPPDQYRNYPVDIATVYMYVGTEFTFAAGNAVCSVNISDGFVGIDGVEVFSTRLAASRYTTRFKATDLTATAFQSVFPTGLPAVNPASLFQASFDVWEIFDFNDGTKITFTFDGAIYFGNAVQPDCNGNGSFDGNERTNQIDCFATYGPAGSRGWSDGRIDTCECVANWDRDGSIGSGDLTSYISAWFSDLASGTDAAAITCTGVTGSGDLTLFVNLWFAAVAGTNPAC